MPNNISPLGESPVSTSVAPMGLLMPDCGVIITKQDLLDHGYPYDGLLPITKEKAYALFDQGAELYAP